MPVNINDYREMFNGCILLRVVDMSNSSKVIYFTNTLAGCTSLVSSPVIDFSSALDLTGLYSGCIGLTNVKFINLTNEVTTDNILDGCNNIKTLTFNGKTNKTSARTIIDTLNNLISSEGTSLSLISNEVDQLSDRADNFDVQQSNQDMEILTSMMASIDIFEMVLSMV